MSRNEGFDIRGLTKEEVEERIKEGKVNILPKAPSRTIWQIIRANVCTVFNALNVILAGIVFLAGSPKNALFAIVILTNTIIGIFQELKAKHTVEKLSLINSVKAKVLRDGKEETINIQDIVLGDTIILSPGDQIIVDAVVESNDDLGVDESLLTGESDVISKKKGDRLLAGSFLILGSCYAKVICVGEDTYTAKLAKEAKSFKIINSELQISINKIVRVIMYLIIPVGALLMGSQLLFSDKNWREASLSAVAGIAGMVPEGLVLLTTATFLVGVIKLSKWNTLVQELPATEVLARVDVLCLDKTGTITEGKLKIADVLPLNSYSEDYINEVLSAIAHSFKGVNATQEALLNRYRHNPEYKVEEKIPFSSAKKWSAVSFEGDGSYYIGAPEMLLNNRYDEIKEVVNSEAKMGRRVLLVGKINRGLESEAPKDLEGIALVLIEDIIREEAPDTLKYFDDQGVSIKIISGDNPVTVAAVAKRAGVKNADSYIDARNLPDDTEKLETVIDATTVFGRVTPHQKKTIVKALQSKGHTVGMTGDGVNDVLALKESDCGIAMATGSDAARAVSQIVLLDSNFAALPNVVSEGRQIINNLQSVAGLYITKSIYSLLLSIIFAVIMLPYPFIPIQLTFVGSFAIGIPSFFLALLPNRDRVQRGFLKRVLIANIPQGIAVAAFTLVIVLIGTFYNLSQDEIRTLAVIVSGGIAIIVLYRISKPLTILKWILLIAMIGIFVSAFMVPVAVKIFSLTQTVSMHYFIICLVLIVISAPTMNILEKITSNIINKYYADKLV